MIEEKRSPVDWELLGRIIDGSPIPMFAINTEHKVTHWNRALEVMSGIKREEIIGTNQQWRAFYQSQRPVMADLIVSGATAEEIESYYKGKCKKSLLIEGAYEAEDYSHTAKPGMLWLHFTASPIRDSKGNLIGAIETLEDVAERKKAEEALQKSEKRFRDLYESALDPIWVSDMEGKILLANKAAAECTGYTVEELLKMNVKDLLTEESLKIAREIKYKLLHQNIVEAPYEQTLRNKDGSNTIFMVKTNLLTDDGKPIAFQSISRDVTKEKRMTENLRYYLQQITRAQEDERKRISQELHDSTAQSLIAILHRLENLLDRKTIPSSESQELKKIYEQIKGTLHEVRRFSRDLRPSILDDLGLIPALEWVTDQIKNEYGINTTLKILNASRRLTNEAELLLFRIVQEALRNIVKHARATSAEVTMEFQDNIIKLVITDDGTGFQVPENIDDLSKVNKLGLIGMQERVQLLGGTFRIDSAPGKGTKIIITAPV